MSEDEKPPADKVRTITLSGDLSANEYMVQKLTDSVEFMPGQLINKDEVRQLCEDAGWKVTVIKPK